MAEERGGDVAKTKTGYATAVKQGKVAGWYSAAKAHYDSQPVATEFQKKAADAIVAGDAAQQARAAQAQATRDEATAA